MIILLAIDTMPRNARLGDVMQFIRKYPTTLGHCALIFWALGALFTTQIRSLPLFEALAIVFSVSFLFSLIRLALTRNWKHLKQPWFLWIIGFAGIYGNDLLYIESFKHAPAAQADLINYLWPILVVLFTGFLPNEKLTLRHLLAAALGFTGIAILLLNGQKGFETQYASGYLLALLNAVIWTIYTLSARYYGKETIETIGVYFGLSAIFSIAMHFKTESLVYPLPEQWAVLLIMGATTQGLAYYFWAFGVKQGNFKLLSVLSYFSPILSVGFLVWFRKVEPSLELLFACLMVSFAGLIASMNWNRISQHTQWITDLFYLTFEQKNRLSESN